MSLETQLAEDRRIILLRGLQECSGGQMNETICKLMVNKFGHRSGRDVVRADLQWLADQRLVRLEKLDAQGGEFWVAHLTEEGNEVAEGRRHPGVGRRFG